jgi:hypothetical protein
MILEFVGDRQWQNQTNQNDKKHSTDLEYIQAVRLDDIQLFKWREIKKWD